MKIIRNTTLSSILVQDTGVYINAGESYTIDEQTYLLWAGSESVTPLVTSGDLVVNDGAGDLLFADGLRFLKYPDRLSVKLNSAQTTIVTTELNFTGAVTVADNGDGKATVNIGSGTPEPCLREVTLVMLGGTLPMNIESNLLFEPDPINNIIKFFKEEVV
jgi:hypothetical protein